MLTLRTDYARSNANANTSTQQCYDATAEQANQYKWLRNAFKIGI